MAYEDLRREAAFRELFDAVDATIVKWVPDWNRRHPEGVPGPVILATLIAVLALAAHLERFGNPTPTSATEPCTRDLVAALDGTVERFLDRSLEAGGSLRTH